MGATGFTRCTGFTGAWSQWDQKPYTNASTVLGYTLELRSIHFFAPKPHAKHWWTPSNELTLLGFTFAHFVDQLLKLFALLPPYWTLRWLQENHMWETEKLVLTCYREDTYKPPDLFMQTRYSSCLLALLKSLILRWGMFRESGLIHCRAKWGNRFHQWPWYNLKISLSGLFINLFLAWEYSDTSFSSFSSFPFSVCAFALAFPLAFPFAVYFGFPSAFGTGWVLLVAAATNLWAWGLTALWRVLMRQESITSFGKWVHSGMAKDKSME